MSSVAAVGSPMLHEDVEMPLAEEEDVMMVDSETPRVADAETQTVADAETQTETEATAETQENQNDSSVHVQNDFQPYDSKKETGYVGLKNHGATCYMNSLLQTLFHIPYFRKAVYEMPTTENDMVACTIPLALQRLFYRLQYSNKRVSTKGLTRSFGWNTYDLFTQHDVQELNRVFVEKMENKMQGTLVEGTVQQLFEGHHMSYIDCINVDYKSTRRESFYDLQLDVKGCQDVYESFDKYVEVENLDGENKYRAEQHGLQDAKKGILFLDFPPVLQLHLKRFEYDFMRDAMIKINDRYEFPLQLDLDKDNCKYLSPDADKRIRNLYTLHSVLVHTGGGHGGHYYAFIRPTLSDQWYKFDDERVTKEDMKQALEEQFGGEDETDPGYNYAPSKSIKFSNAYMLVYIRESDKDKIICKADEMDIAAHSRIRLRKEREEKELRRKGKAEANLYTLMRIARENDLAQQIGRDVIFDLVDYDKVDCFHVFKTKLFVVFKEELSQKYNIPVQCQRFWVWAKRENQTCRPDRPLLLHEEVQPVGYLEEMFSKNSARELRLFLEVNSNMGHRLLQPEKTQEEILLCFKFYDPEKEKISYTGMAIVSALSKPLDYLSKLKDMVGFSPEEEVVLYEEIQVEPLVTLDRINVNITFHDNQLKDGDIICFQKDYSSEDVQQRFPDVPSFFNYIRNRQIVGFRSLEKPKEDEFYLELSKLDDYIEVAEKVAQKIGIDDISRIRLTSHNCCTNSPNSQPIKYRVDYHLLEMLIHYNQSSDILYYEVLDIPLPEFQDMKSLQLYFYNPTVQVASEIMLHLPKQSTFQDVVKELRTKVELQDPNVAIRVIELFDHRIYKIFPPNEKIENVKDQRRTLRAEEVPEEEQNLGAQDRLIRVYHFNQAASESINYFGEPFLLAIHEGETLADIKVRIKEKLLVSDEEFSKWKFAFFSTGCPEYLQASDVLSIHFQRYIYGGWEPYLGLEHTDNSQKKSQVNQNRHVSEKPVKIYN